MVGCAGVQASYCAHFRFVLLHYILQKHKFMHGREIAFIHLYHMWVGMPSYC